MMPALSVHDIMAPPARAGLDVEWDEFVALHPGGEHVQSGLWSRLKGTEGWRTVRVEARDGDHLVGGAQILIRHLPVLGSFAYVPKAPLVSDLETARGIIDRLMSVAEESGVRHLTVQPPRTGDEIAELLERRGFSPAPISVAPVATLVLDLTASEDQLLAGMHRSTRYNIRLASRKGLTCREGGREDIAVFHDMLAATAERQGFSPHSRGYLETMWDVFSPIGQIVLLIVERDGTPLSGMIGIGFGDTFTDKLAAWSGLAREDRPTQAVQWCAIRWARNAGYRFYDFEGIDPVAAQVLMAGDPLPEELRQSVSSFKAGFGGTPVVSPSAWHLIDKRLVGWVYDRYTRLNNGSRLAKYVSNQIRRGRSR